MTATQTSISNTLLTLAMQDIGTREIKGSRHNPQIVQWLQNVGIRRGDDETPWCAAWMYDLVNRVEGAPLPHRRRAAARSWLNVGASVDLDAAKPGDIVIFDRGRGRGHVGLFLREQTRSLVVLGGNQGNRVWPKSYRKNKLLGVQRLSIARGVPADLSTRGTALRSVQDEALELFHRKNRDYGDSVAAHGPIGVLTRMGGKLSRLVAVSRQRILLVDSETLRDTLLDLHNYSGMAITLLDEENGE